MCRYVAMCFKKKSKVFKKNPNAYYNSTKLNKFPQKKATFYSIY